MNPAIIENVYSKPAEGASYFERPKVLDKLHRQVEEQSSVLILGPRRIGKTSLVHKLCNRWMERDNRKAVFVSVEKRRDELGFVEELLDALSRSQLKADILTRISSIANKIRQTIGGKGIKLPGFDLSLGEVADPDHITLGNALESVLRKVNEDTTRVLIAIDELPELLLSLQKTETNGTQRVGEFLHRLRYLRQTYRKNIYWVYIGSIGLDTFAESQGHLRALNDVSRFQLDVFTNNEADALLAQLSISYNLSLTTQERAHIITKIKWPMAHHIQLIFDQLLHMNPRNIDSAFEALLPPLSYSHFGTWDERIDILFPSQQAEMCREILDNISKYPDGCERSQIIDVLKAGNTPDLPAISKHLPRLLGILQRDYYLVESNGRYAFRSYLIREYWYRNRVR